MRLGCLRAEALQSWPRESCILLPGSFSWAYKAKLHEYTILYFLGLLNAKSCSSCLNCNQPITPQMRTLGSPGLFPTSIDPALPSRTRHVPFGPLFPAGAAPFLRSYQPWDPVVHCQISIDPYALCCFKKLSDESFYPRVRSKKASRGDNVSMIQSRQFLGYHPFHHTSPTYLALWS